MKISNSELLNIGWVGGYRIVPEGAWSLLERVPVGYFPGTYVYVGTSIQPLQPQQIKNGKAEKRLQCDVG